MKKYLLLALLFTLNVNAQFFKKAYEGIFKYATVYVAGDMREAYETQYPDYFIRTNPDDLYAIPFNYELKPNYIDGSENLIGLSAPISAVKGLEYLFHYERERERSEEFDNTRYFIRHTGKYHIVKLESRKQGNVNFQYQSAEIRARLPIGQKFGISAGAIARSHQKAYGYNPIEIWLNETQVVNNQEVPKNRWYSLGYYYGYEDELTQYTNIQTGESFYDWIWRNEDGEIVAYGDRDFRDRVFGGLMNRFNREQWDLLDPFAEVAPIVGFDFYHYRSKFWLHAYANWILPHHEYIKGNEDFSYLHRNSWGKGGHNNLLEGEQWSDYQGGIIAGWKISKTLGLFIEGEYIKFWDSEILNSSVGLNFRL